MPSKADVTISVLSVELDGSPMSPQLSRSLFEVEVENSLYLPSSFTIRFQLNSVEGNELKLIDNDFKNALSDGTAVKIVDKGSNKVILEGTVTSVSLEFSAIVPSGPIYAIVQGFDNSHKLHRGRHTRTFLKQKSSDIVSTLASEAGLSASVDATSTKHEYIIQSNQTNWELIWQLASRVGYEVYVEGNTLNFKKPREQRGSVPLTWGVDLQQFRTRASTSFQWSKAIVRGWDQKKKEIIEGDSNSGEETIKLKDSRKGIDQAKGAFGDAELIVADVFVQDNAEANAMAQSLIDSLAGEFMEAEGVTSWGMAEILPGVRVDVKGMGRHSGQYYVISSTHRYSTMEGYTTSFTVGGRHPNTLMDYMGGNSGSPALDRIQGVVIGVVTNNNDPDGLSRVKAKFPWLGQDIESNWARIAFPGAGPTRGMNWLPEINDEVLIAFEHGDIHRPYVLGGLWNQKDKAPESNSSIVKDKKVNLRSLKSREGLGLTISDESGKRSITMSNPDDDSKVTILHDDKVVEILSNGDINITGKQGKITIEGKDIEIKSSTNLKLDAKTNVEIKAGANLKIDAKANLNMKGGAQAVLQGLTTSVKGSTMTEVKGTLVKIN